ncbi:MAG: exodeoxyribonuclease III [Cytophagales bacterium]|nr:exodeoxyribonuclease III [Cytophagales bacterium]
MKLVSYNVNGIRAAVKKGFDEWLLNSDIDIIALQETKALQEQVDTSFLEENDFEHYWFSAEKKGYSGVAIFSKVKPNHVEYGCNISAYDQEGRALRADFDGFSLLNVYMPSGSSGDTRQDFKMQWLADFFEYIQELRKEIPNLIICGDFNICHTEIDIHNPKTNKNTSGFLPEEREWMTNLFNNQWIDTFRVFEPNPHHYSWWSYRANARNNNKGWRIDYFVADEALKEKLTNASILPDVKHSDHCPIVLEINP